MKKLTDVERAERIIALHHYRNAKSLLNLHKAEVDELKAEIKRLKDKYEPDTI